MVEAFPRRGRYNTKQGFHLAKLSWKLEHGCFLRVFSDAASPEGWKVGRQLRGLFLFSCTESKYGLSWPLLRILLQDTWCFEVKVWGLSICRVYLLRSSYSLTLSSSQLFEELLGNTEDTDDSAKRIWIIFKCLYLKLGFPSYLQITTYFVR